MILVCVGASEFGMDRLLKYMDELCDEKVIEGSEIVAQSGVSTYVPHNYKAFSLIARDEFQKYVKDADVIITHAGTGSVIPPLKLGKKVIVFPRREKYHEHIDDHQLELADVFTSGGYTLCATTKEELQECIDKCATFIPKKFVSVKGNIDRLIIDFLEKK